MLTTRDFASQVWDFELFAVQDNIEVDGQVISGKRSVTVDKVVTALAILIVGYWFAVRLARLVEGHSVTRLGIDASLARIARRWILFLEVMLLVVLSMMVVKIPLTIFAFMGGALAIGAGFGMQNMLKNLISGLCCCLSALSAGGCGRSGWYPWPCHRHRRAQFAHYRRQRH